MHTKCTYYIYLKEKKNVTEIVLFQILISKTDSKVKRPHIQTDNATCFLGYTLKKIIMKHIFDTIFNFNLVSWDTHIIITKLMQ